MEAPASLVLETGDPVTRHDEFDAFVAEHGQSLLRLAYVLTGDAQNAEDAVQDALARALPRWDSIGRTSDPAAYLRRMVVNANVSRWRRFRRETPVAVVVPAEHAADVADLAVDRAARQQVWDAVLALPRAQRVAVALRYHEGLSYAEIGESAGWPEATARSHVFRGLAALRTALVTSETSED